MLDDLHEAAANALPPRREDEPASLRQEILDELSDHFACAYRRELLRTQGDAELSKRNLLARFGDPGKIARRLWFDAMKGKLMAQKLMVFATVISAVLMAFIAFAGWRLVEASQQATSALIAQSQETSAALLAQSEKTNAAILARMESQKGKADWSGSLEWRKIEVKFVDAVTGEPVKDVSVSLNGPDGSTVYQQSLSDIQPSESGVVEMSPVYIGSYSLKISLPDGFEHHEAVTVRPGHDFRKTFQVPKMPDTGKFDFQIEWPERLRGRDIWLTIAFINTSSLTIDNNPWWYQRPKFFAVHTDGRVVDLVSYFHTQGGKSVAVGLNGEVDDLFYQASTKYRSHPDAPTSNELVTGQVRIKAMGIHTASSFPPESSQQLFLTSLHEADLAGIAIKPDMPNVWKIKIPDEVANAIPDEKLPPRMPVEAPKTSHDDGYSQYERYALVPVPTTVTIHCVDDSPAASPIPNAELTFHRTSNDPVRVFDSKGQLIPAYGDYTSELKPFGSDLAPCQTDANGTCRIENIRPGDYSVTVTLPDGTSSVMEGLEDYTIHPDGTVEKTIVCPTVPRRFPVDLAVSWPTIAKRRDDVWVVLEIGEELRQETRTGTWSTPANHLVAIHPDGRMVQWTIDPETRGRSIYDLVDWPQNEGQIVTYKGEVTTTTSEEVRLPLWLKADHRLLGYGIARWDGNGSQDELLRGIRDGRYSAGQELGRPVFNTRGIFFQIFREIVPMASYKKPPPFEIRPAGNGVPTFAITVPEPLVQSALNRWDELPVVNNSDENS